MLRTSETVEKENKRIRGETGEKDKVEKENKEGEAGIQGTWMREQV